MGNKSVKNLMINKYGEKCWLDYKLTKENQITYHHIDPVRNGGKATEENGALLSEFGHRHFNKLEELYPEHADKINKYFKIYKGEYPDNIKKEIDSLLALVNIEEKTKVKKKNKKR